MTEALARVVALVCWGLAGAAGAQTLAPVAGPAVPRLLATVVHGDGTRSLAMVSLDGAPAQTVRIGHPLAGGFTVHAIERDRLLLARSGELHVLPVRGPGASAAGPLPLHVPALAARSPAQAPVTGPLQAQDIGSVRAACADRASMAALPPAQRGELAALGICPLP